MSFYFILLLGIDCPRAARPLPGGAGEIPSDPFGKEALLFTKELVLQREVCIHSTYCEAITEKKTYQSYRLEFILGQTHPHI